MAERLPTWVPLLVLGTGLAGCGGLLPGGGDGGGAAPATAATAIERSCELAPPAPGVGFQIDEGRFRIESRQDAVYCRQYGLPPELREGGRFVTGFASALPESTHHFVLGYNPDKQAPPVEGTDGASCYPDNVTGIDDLKEGGISLETGDFTHAGAGGGWLAGAGVGDYDFRFPDGYGIALSTGNAGAVAFSHHVLNFADRPVDMCGKFNVYTGNASQVHHPVALATGSVAWIHVPPGEEASVGAVATADVKMDIVLLASHAHHNLLRFRIGRYDGRRIEDGLIYESTNWDSPKVKRFDPPLTLEPGEGLVFQCDYFNPYDRPLGFGVGEYGEMCSMVAFYAHPASDMSGRIPPARHAVFLRSGATPKPFQPALRRR